MGSGSFDTHAYASYATAATTRADGSAKSIHEVFENSRLAAALNPKGVNRESRDSVDNPNSTAIIIGLDVTGSMGMIAHSMMKTQLGTLLAGIMEQKPVTDPHIMIMGIGDAVCDSAPLQVSQFEADIRIAEQLKELYMEGGGGGNNSESYDFPWYFAAKHTSIDCWEKRQKKGYLFTIGDELFPYGLSKQHLKDACGDTDVPKYTGEELLTMVKETYDVFHIIVLQGNYARSRGKKQVVGNWKERMGSAAIPLDDYEYLPEVIIAAMRLNEGEEFSTVMADYPHCQETMKVAFGA